MGVDFFWEPEFSCFCCVPSFPKITGHVSLFLFAVPAMGGGLCCRASQGCALILREKLALFVIPHGCSVDFVSPLRSPYKPYTKPPN